MSKRKLSNWLLIGVVSILLGLFGGLSAYAFIRLLKLIEDTLWHDLPEALGLGVNTPVFIITLTLMGGLLVGLARKFFGDYPKNLEHDLKEFRRTKKLDYKHLPNAGLASLASLGFGGSLGPEAALVAIVGGIATWIGDKLKAMSRNVEYLTHAGISGVLGGLFGSPFGSAVLPVENDSKKPLPRRTTLFAGILAALSGLWVFSLFANGGYFAYDFLPYETQVIDWLYAIPIAVVGAAIGIIFLQLKSRLKSLFKPLDSKPVHLAVIGGLGLGIMGSISSFMLFSGHEGIQTIMSEYGEQTAGVLILLSLGKVLALSLCLSSGWKGGRFFPVMFAGSAIGLAIAQLIPGVPPLLALAVGMSSATAAVIPKPLAVMLLMVFIFPRDLYIPIAIASLSSAFLVTRIKFAASLARR